MDAGSVYLYNASGVLQTTITNPTPAAYDQFGFAVAGIGTDRIAVGAPNDNTGATAAGAVYVYSTAGVLLATITNPAPAAYDQFGFAVAAVGTDRIVIGAPAPNYGGEAVHAGIAYLYSTNGALLATIPNPVPAAHGVFGWAVATVGSDRFAVGAPYHTLDTTAASAYVFDRNGALLCELPNDFATSFGGFGRSLSAIDADRVIVGVPLDDTGAVNAGAVCLYTLTGRTMAGWVAADIAEQAVGSAQIADGAVASAKLAAGAVGAAQLADGGVLRSDIGAGAVGTHEISPFAVHSSNLGSGSVTADKLASGTDVSLLVTITNPAPRSSARFGTGVAGVGSGTMAISVPYSDAGAVNAGAVYLYNTGGELLTTITNPAPAVDDLFADSVATMGPDTIIVAAPSQHPTEPDYGNVYLYDTGGALVRTIRAPFGPDMACAGVGSNKIAIGTPCENSYSGRAFLYSMESGGWLIISNPTPAGGDLFGEALAGLGNNCLAISAPNDNTGATGAGAVYLYNTNGTLLVTIANPAPGTADQFGKVLASVGTDKIAISAPLDDAGATDAGAVYLYSTNGLLLATIPNPAPAEGDYFGCSVSAVGTNRILVGACNDNAAGTGSGIAYLFDLSGNLLSTLDSPSALSGDLFGSAVAGLGNDTLIVSAPANGSGSPAAGCAYVFGVGTSAPAVSRMAIQNGAVSAAKVDASTFGTTFWKADGNAGTTPGTHFIGTTDNQPLQLRANNLTAITIATGGNVGIGTNAPSERLDVGGGRIGGVGAPDTADDAANKAYVDSCATGLSRIMVSPLTMMASPASAGTVQLVAAPEGVRIIPLSSGTASVFVPVTLPSMLLNATQRLVSVSIAYCCSNTASYIGTTSVRATDDAGGTVTLASTATDYTNTTWRTYAFTNSVPPVISGATTVQLDLNYSATGTTHEIAISRVTLTTAP
jgi:hypothetical protein